MIRHAFAWFWRTGILSTFLAGLFALLPIVVTVGIMAWVGGSLREWFGPDSFVGGALSRLGFHFVTNPTIASALGWIAVLLAIWLLGVLLKSVGKKRVERTFHAMMERIPLVNLLYGPVAQVVEMLQRDSANQLQGMSVVFCSFGREGGAGVLALLASEQTYCFNGQACQIVYVPTSPLPMSGLVIFAAADSVQKVDMPVDDLIKICLSIGVMSSRVIPDQYVVALDNGECLQDYLDKMAASVKPDADTTGATSGTRVPDQSFPG